MILLISGNRGLKFSLLADAGIDFLHLTEHAALANHDWPERVRNGLSLNEFDPALLQPLADIKANEIG
jgi:hypothetical protein